jgi:predicted nucleic acid-binding protein
VITLDTSAILALLDASDPDHARCLDALRGEGPPLVVPAAILGEAGYLIEIKLGTPAVVDFVHDLERRAFTLDCGERDFRRVTELLERYADLRLGLADAGVIACAERRGGRVLTLDFRDFGPVAREGRIALALAG